MSQRFRGYAALLFALFASVLFAPVQGCKKKEPALPATPPPTESRPTPTKGLETTEWNYGRYS